MKLDCKVAKVATIIFKERQRIKAAKEELKASGLSEKEIKERIKQIHKESKKFKAKSKNGLILLGNITVSIFTSLYFLYVLL